MATLRRPAVDSELLDQLLQDSTVYTVLWWSPLHLPPSPLILPCAAANHPTSPSHIAASCPSSHVAMYARVLVCTYCPSLYPSTPYSVLRTPSTKLRCSIQSRSPQNPRRGKFHLFASSHHAPPPAITFSAPSL